ncbi:MAG: VWA domain-containing protein [Saprospiraceae bacterium]|nr:VWA domain-containing protein [Saprospiraceae bacterium]
MTTATATFSNLEQPKNFEEKTLCTFVIDTSSSMSSSGKIVELNNGLRAFQKQIAEDEVLSARLEVAIVEFNSDVRVAQSPILAEDLAINDFVATGTTRLVDGVNLAIDMSEDRKKYYKEQGLSYKRPYVVLISDGEPDGGQNIQALANRINDDTLAQKYVFVPLGVTTADMMMLSKIEGYLNKETKMPAKSLAGRTF